MIDKLLLLLLFVYCVYGLDSNEVNKKANENLSSEKNLGVKSFEFESVEMESDEIDGQKSTTCKSIVGYFDGKFQNTIFPDINTNVQFQLRLTLNDTNKEFYGVIDRWNEKQSSGNDFKLFVEDDQGANRCSIEGPSCSVLFKNEASTYFDTDLEYYLGNENTYDNHFTFAYFPLSNNSFTMTNTIGQCTKNQIQKPQNENWNANTTLFEYCLCCGDKYNPDPKLKCPKNPWA